MAGFAEIMEFRNKSNKFASYMGIRTTEMKAGYAKGEMNIKGVYENAISSVHGGCIFTLADTIGGSAAASHGDKMTTISSDFHYLSPELDTDKLYCTGREVKYGKKIAVYDVEVTDVQGRLIAKGLFSYYNLGEPLLL